MTKQPKNNKTTRRQHTREFRAPALALTEKISVAGLLGIWICMIRRPTIAAVELKTSWPRAIWKNNK